MLDVSPKKGWYLMLKHDQKALSLRLALCTFFPKEGARGLQRCMHKQSVFSTDQFKTSNSKLHQSSCVLLSACFRCIRINILKMIVTSFSCLDVIFKSAEI